MSTRSESFENHRILLIFHLYDTIKYDTILNVTVHDFDDYIQTIVVENRLSFIDKDSKQEEAK